MGGKCVCFKGRMEKWVFARSRCDISASFFSFFCGGGQGLQPHPYLRATRTELSSGPPPLIVSGYFHTVAVKIARSRPPPLLVFLILLRAPPSPHVREKRFYLELPVCRRRRHSHLLLLRLGSRLGIRGAMTRSCCSAQPLVSTDRVGGEACVWIRP